MASLWARKRRFIPGLTALALILALYFVARLPTASADTRAELASRYRFTEMPIAMPPGYKPTQTERTVNPAFRHLRSWISAVGAAVAINDLQGNGRPDDMCLVDTRTDKVVVTYAPTAPAADRFTPFALDPAPLPVHPAMAPMGCAPGDFNGDGRMDLMVYYWGRTPILFLAKTGTRALAPDTYERVELVPQGSADGAYHGPRWNTNAVNVADFDGDGHADILVSNYFPDSDVLDPHGLNNVQMNASMSNAKNGGGSHVLRWQNATAGPRPTATFAEARGALPFKASSGWTLAASSADLTGDGVPELYLANDFGKDHLLHNRSTPGTIRFGEVIGKRSPTTPKSFVIGKSSFKGMGVDFGDLNNSGRFDMSVSNITTAWGLEESNFTWINQAGSEADMQRYRRRGGAVHAEGPRDGAGVHRLGLGRQDGRLPQQREAGDRPDRGLRQGEDQPLAVAPGDGHDQRQHLHQPRDVAQRAARRRHRGKPAGRLLRPAGRRALRQPHQGTRPGRPDPHAGRGDGRHPAQRRARLRPRPPVGPAGCSTPTTPRTWAATSTCTSSGRWPGVRTARTSEGSGRPPTG